MFIVSSFSDILLELGTKLEVAIYFFSFMLHIRIEGNLKSTILKESMKSMPRVQRQRCLRWTLELIMTLNFVSFASSVENSCKLCYMLFLDSFFFFGNVF